VDARDRCEKISPTAANHADRAGLPLLGCMATLYGRVSPIILDENGRSCTRSTISSWAPGAVLRLALAARIVVGSVSLLNGFATLGLLSWLQRRKSTVRAENVRRTIRWFGEFRGLLSFRSVEAPIGMRRTVCAGLVALSLANLLPSFGQSRATTPSPQPQTAPAPAKSRESATPHQETLNPKRKITVGDEPYGLAFDGVNIWTANHDGSSVTKVRRNDGAVLGTFAVGRGPYGVAFDGTHIWATSNVENTVTKLRASDGKNMGTFSVGKGPWWLSSDGANIWVANGNGSVTKLRADDGRQLGTYAVGEGAIAVAFDGSDIWVTSDRNYVTKLRASDGTVVGTYTVGNGAMGIVFDGTNIWVANRGSSSVSKLRASDGQVLGTFAAPGAPYGLAFDGKNIWVTGSPYLMKLRATDGTLLSKITLLNTSGIIFDGTSVWVAQTPTSLIEFGTRE